MNSENNPLMIPLREFVGSKQSSLFQTLKQPQFTGQLIFTSAQGQEWLFYLYLGRILYATGGEHIVRRWKRNILCYAPHLIPRLSLLKEEINVKTTIKECWEYDLLAYWFSKQEINREQLIKIIRSIIVEIFFDVTQTMEVSFQLKANQPLSKQLILLDPEQVIVEAWEQWQRWQGAKLANKSPNRAPIVKQKHLLREKTSPKTSEIMIKLFNGKNTLRDIAISLKQDMVQITRLIIPYLQLGFIELIEIPDLVSPLLNSKNYDEDVEIHQNVIVCIDDDLKVAQTMKGMLKNQDCQFLSFNNPNLAIASMLETPPDLIFLNLEMSHNNGYDICSRLRKLSSFQNVPVIIMTENVGLMDRVKGKIIGCTDFLSKPIEAKIVLDLISKYLK